MIFAMTKEQYIKITEPLRNNQERANRVTSLNHVLTALVFCVYPLYLFMLFADKDPWLWRAILVPAVSFVGLSIVRKIINAPRPYEKFDMPPVLEKDTKGKAFPSRHVFSVFIIAMTIFYEHPGAGVMLGSSVCFLASCACWSECMSQRISLLVHWQGSCAELLVII